ncbi:MAG: MFS family permease, partial [Halieaceae bacterium]
AAWIMVLNACQIAAALSLKDSERGRGLSMLYVAAVGGMALLSPVWGWIAKETSPSTSFLLSAIAGVFLVASISLFWREQRSWLDPND